MVIKLLVDANLDGHAKLLLGRMQTDSWRGLYEHVSFEVHYLKDVGLDRKTKDNLVWRLCQERGYTLLTANRDEDSDDSLETTIRREGALDSLPVLTLADAQRIYHSSAYLDEVVESLFDYLLNQDDYRGSGRLFLP